MWKDPRVIMMESPEEMKYKQFFLPQMKSLSCQFAYTTHYVSATLGDGGYLCLMNDGKYTYSGLKLSV